jgi:Protein of unknown function (DUF429)
MSDDRVFIGIDPTAGVRHSTLAVLDSRLKIVRLEDMSLDAIFEIVTGFDTAICGIDAPIAPSKGLMADPEYRRRLGLEPGSKSYSNYRVGEYELRRRRIALYNTPVDPQQAKPWMQEGWKLYERLRKAGFVEYPHPGARRMFETFPYGGFAVLAGRRPYPKASIRGLLQRQLILFDEGLDVPDPMHNLEEWTRHRLMTGQVTHKGLYTHDQLDALIAAYTAFRSEKEPHDVSQIGDSGEGQIVLPVASLKDAY